METTQEKTAIDKIIDSFDFDAVLKFCTENNRTYIEKKITKEMLIETAQYCLIRAQLSENECNYVSTGGFKATKMTFSHGTYLTLDFILKTWDEKLY